MFTSSATRSQSFMIILSALVLMVAFGISGGCGPLYRMRKHTLQTAEDCLYGDTGNDACSDSVKGGEDLLTIDMPFADGYRSLCTQGANGSYSHHSRSTTYDVDFDTPNSTRDPVYAPVGGVAYVHDTDRTRNYGEHINIDEGDGSYIILAHLDDVFIADGDEVAAGQLLGYEGATGAAVGDHMHIGRHAGDAARDGIYGTSVSGLAFAAYDASAKADGAVLTSDMTCGLDTGHVYESQLPTPLWHPSGSLVKTPDSATVYLLDGFTLEPFVDENSFTSRNYSWNDIAVIAEDETECYGVGAAISGTGLVTAVRESSWESGAWLVVGSSTDANRYRSQLSTAGLEAVLATWGIPAGSVFDLPTASEAGVSLSGYPSTLETATFRDGSLVSTVEKSDVYVMEGGAALPIADWDTNLLMGFGSRSVTEVAQSDFDVLVDIVGDCAADSSCVSAVDVTTCGGDTEDNGGTYPGEGEGGADDTTSDIPTTPATGEGLELWWWLDTSADWETISGQFTESDGTAYPWSSNITWSTWSPELYFAISVASSGDTFRYSYAGFQNGATLYGCNGPFPPGSTVGHTMATWNGRTIPVTSVADPTSNGCGFQVTVP